MDKNSRKPIDDDEFAENRRTQMYQLGAIIKTLDEYKQIKKQVDFHDKLLRDIDLWRH